MVRPLRIQFEGALYHVTSRGDGGETIFTDQREYEEFLKVLEKMVTEYGWICHGYCLMGNHFHLVVETPKGNLSEGMHYLNGVVTQRFNRRHKRTGHLLQGRFHSVLIQKESHLLAVVRYVVLNPVRAGLAKGPENWPWSSYRGMAGLETPPAWLQTAWTLGRWATDEKLARRCFRRFVAEGIGGESPFAGARGGIILGEEEFAREALEAGKVESRRKGVRIKETSAGRPTLAWFLGAPSRKRVVVMRQALESCLANGYNRGEIAGYLGVNPSTLKRWLEGSPDPTENA